MYPLAVARHNRLLVNHILFRHKMLLKWALPLCIVLYLAVQPTEGRDKKFFVVNLSVSFASDFSPFPNLKHQSPYPRILPTNPHI